MSFKTYKAHISLASQTDPLPGLASETRHTYRLVMQFHATDGQSRTLFQELRAKKSNSSHLIAFCAQLVEAVHYLHHEVEILHNDITTTNVVLDNDHIVLIDFGKATKVSEAKLYHLAEAEKPTKYPHMVQQMQSIYIDMYAVGLVLYNITYVLAATFTPVEKDVTTCPAHLLLSNVWYDLL